MQGGNAGVYVVPETDFGDYECAAYPQTDTLGVVCHNLRQ
jgi:hypothetical protein